MKTIASIAFYALSIAWMGIVAFLWFACPEQLTFTMLIAKAASVLVGTLMLNGWYALYRVLRSRRIINTIFN